jgi:hypothetical protein
MPYFLFFVFVQEDQRSGAQMTQEVGSGAEKAANERPDRVNGAALVGDIGTSGALGQLEDDPFFFEVSFDTPGFNLGLRGYPEGLTAGRTTREARYLGDQGIKVLDFQMTMESLTEQFL